MLKRKKAESPQREVPPALIEFLERSQNGEYVKIETAFTNPGRIVVPNYDFDEECYLFGISN